ncbi:hypothetical protein [Halorubrum sp. SD626R]|uniref:hypothetical protein n=1 Tax=Halorubrum sp. SD626R TaxID=1419722 RepID=UPI0011358B9A|nr:hypothetical protein [Halorubrum sp. SD626R]TKX81346.1 hypothetical protein EXE53_06490 [Halorubrum sp. SD626R]
MNRRCVLSAVGTSALALSGCLNNRTEDGTAEGSGSVGGPSVTISLTHVAGDEAISLNSDVIRSEITEESPAVIELIAKNETESAIEYGTGAPAPFGALYDPDSPEAILWNKKYVESQHVETDGRRITGMNDIGISVRLSPEETRSETYEFAAPPGRYSIQRTGNPLTLGEETYELDITVSET